MLLKILNAYVSLLLSICRQYHLQLLKSNINIHLRLYFQLIIQQMDNQINLIIMQHNKQMEFSYNFLSYHLQMLIH